MVICVNSRGTRCSSQNFAIHCKACGSNQSCTEDRHYCADNACSGCRAILLSGSARMSNSGASSTTTGGVPKGFSNNFFSPVVRITLAPPLSSSTISLASTTQDQQEQTYHLHSALLTQHSQYFTSLFSFNNRASITDTSVTLSEPVDDPTAFKCFVEFLYCNDYNFIPSPSEGPPSSTVSGPASLDLNLIVRSLPIHGKCYALGERLIAPGFQTAALTKLKAALRTLAMFSATAGPIMATAWITSVVETIRVIYEGTHRPYGADADSLAQREEMVQIPATGRVRGAHGAYSSNSSNKHTQQPYAVVYHLIESNDPARQALANFAAVRVELLRTREEFRVCVRECGEFAEDLLLEVGANGGGMRP